jgi:hypothetical protein
VSGFNIQLICFSSIGSIRIGINSATLRVPVRREFHPTGYRGWR